MKIMDFDLKWVHMAQYGLILRQDGAIWPRIISEPLPTPKRALEGPKNPKESKISNLIFRQVNFVAGCREAFAPRHTEWDCD